ncbi:MAG: glycine hydroxymethyltransferase [Rhodoferax sp.]
MKIFNCSQFVRNFSIPTLKFFVAQHQLFPELVIDWSQSETNIPKALCSDIRRLEAVQADPLTSLEKKQSIASGLARWQDDLKRTFSMANDLAINEFRYALASDLEAAGVFEVGSPEDIALWVLVSREKVFRDAELHLAFQAKTNGKYWKQHLIPKGLDITHDQERLEVFCEEVAQIYQKVGAGKSSHVEVSERAQDGSVQVTIYVEGPLTVIAHFEKNQFNRLSTRIALETALVYHPSNGIVESVVKGGAKNHTAVLELFGKHIVGEEITPEVVEKKEFRLNALRDEMLEPVLDWSKHGVHKVRLRRAKFTPVGRAGVSFQIDVPPDIDTPDAMEEAKANLRVRHYFDAEYAMQSATLIVYMKTREDCKAEHFSFGIQRLGASTIKNLSERNQTIAYEVLKALDIIDVPDGPGNAVIEEQPESVS